MHLAYNHGINMFKAVNNNRLTRDDFNKYFKTIHWDKPSSTVLTNYHHTSPLFEWLGLEKVEELYNYNSLNVNHTYYGMLKKDRYETIAMMDFLEFFEFCTRTLKIPEQYVVR